MKFIIVLLLVVGTALVTISWLRADLKCPPPQVIYRYVPKHMLDQQFSEENNPSGVFEKMFTESSWVGGYKLEDNE